MKRSWQVPLACAVALAVVFATLGWLSMTAWRLEQAEAQARDRAAREQQVRLALWRMDTKLAPLVAQEAARPHEAYAAAAPESADVAHARKPADADPPAPLSRPDDYVVLRFQAGAEGRWSSPEVPTPAPNQSARVQSPVPTLGESVRLLNLLRHTINTHDLLAQLPPAATPDLAALAADETAFAPNAQSVSQQANLPNSPAQSAAKVDDDFLKRSITNRAITLREFEQSRANQKSLPPPRLTPVEGISRPFWLGDRLLLARRVTVGGAVLVDGCWLDWPKLRRDLMAEAADLLPRIEFEPVRDVADGDHAHMLATLPVRLVVPEADSGRGLSLTPLRTSLLVAWASVVVAAAAIAALVWGVVSLSQRRAAFVSAVTHELRTPLTTFRMYAEMLDENMVADEKARKDYLHALRVESDRLAHLVENVLAYARLERGRHAQSRERVTLGELWGRLENHLADRAKRSGLELACRWTDGAGEVAVWTDPAAVEQILFNLVDNAAKYASRASGRTIDVSWSADDRQARICVRDHGPGIAPEVARTLFRPFSKSAQQAANSAPGVGLGLALSRRLARQLGGNLRYEPPNGTGAAFEVTLPRA